jgi:hypothetical protein
MTMDNVTLGGGTETKLFDQYCGPGSAGQH